MMTDSSAIAVEAQNETLEIAMADMSPEDVNEVAAPIATATTGARGVVIGPGEAMGTVAAEGAAC
jgi:hypothetical protein